jgi:hypothetical protein
LALVYRLDRGKDQPPVLLVKIDDSILHFLFSDKKLLIGMRDTAMHLTA